MSSRINIENYTKNHISHVFGPAMPQEKIQPKPRNIQPIKIELKDENISNQKNNVYKPFINKEVQQSTNVGIIKNQYHNESDIFFTKTLSSSMKQKLKEEAFPKKKQYISDYDPKKYVKYNISSFNKKMYELYNEKGDKFMTNKEKEIGNSKKVINSSRGYSEYIEKYNNENYSKFLCMNKNHNLNHKETEKNFYNKEDKYNPTSTAFENYTCEFESDIFNIRNKNYRKFMNKKKNNIRMNRSLDNSRFRNINVKGILQWPANFNWTKNSELIFKTHIKNLARNKSMSAFDRNQIDSVRNLLEGEDENNPPKRIKRNKSDLGKMDFKRPKFDKKEYNISRARKISNNCSVLDDEKKYENNIKIKNMGKKFDVKEYMVAKPGDMDIYEFGKLLKKKGIHLIEVNEKNRNIIENEKNNKNDRIIQFKIRENIFNSKKNEKLNEIEKELKKNNKELRIRPAPKKKSYALKSWDYINKKNGKNKRKEKLIS